MQEAIGIGRRPMQNLLLDYCKTHKTNKKCFLSQLS